MKVEILFIERKKDDFVSIEKVFRQIAQSLSKTQFRTSFQQMAFGNSFWGMIRNLLFFRKKEADIYHITGHIHYIGLILPRRNTVLTIHDLGFLHTRKGLRRYILKKLLLDFPIKKLKYVTAISEATKKEIIHYTGCDEAKIRVIENPLQYELLNQTKKKFNENCPLILQIGTSRNKNLINLINALNGLKCKLKIIGKLENDQLEALEANKIVYENDFGLDDSAIKKEYEKADMVSFCSTYEGFGLPIIEAQAMQRPVLTSNLSPMREVAGDAAFLVNPNDHKDIRFNIEKIINDRHLREEMVEKGLRNVERFHPEIIAGFYEALYKEIAKAQKF